MSLSCAGSKREPAAFDTGLKISIGRVHPPVKADERGGQGMLDLQLEERDGQGMADGLK